MSLFTRTTVHAAVAGAAVLAASGASVAHGATSVVSPANMQGWGFQTSALASGSLVNGPGTPPLGTGSANLQVGSDGNGFSRAFTNNFFGMPLADIAATGSELSYSTYGVGNSVQSPYIQIFLDLNNDNAFDFTNDELIHFEPVYQNGSRGDVVQGPLLANTWQTWDAQSGGWWSVVGNLPGTPGAGIATLAEIAADPAAANAKVFSFAVTAGFGSPPWDNFDGNIDNFTLGTASFASTTYDFEAVPEPAGLSLLALGAVALLGRRRRKPVSIA